MSQAAARTGTAPTASVAVEQYVAPEQRLIHDDLAYAILPLPMRGLVGLMRFAFLRNRLLRMYEEFAPGLWGGMMCRKRYIDERLIEATAQLDALVNLGAGFDTRAYRLRALVGISVWEVDQPENIGAKRFRLQKLFGEVPAHVRLVPLDFERQRLDTALAQCGYSADKRTFFIWEAVTQYLSELGVRTTFDFLAQAAAGSRLTFTYVRKDFLDGRAMYGMSGLYQKYVINEKLWRFGMAPEAVADFLGAYGWRVIEHWGYEELATRYLQPTGRNLAAMLIERVVYAEKV